MKNVEGKDYLQYEWIDLDKIEECPLLPNAIKDILKENKDIYTDSTFKENYGWQLENI